MDSKKEIMQSTYKALCEHGYADLTMEKIAEKSDKGKSLIYYHFEDKQELMMAFLDFLKLKMENDFNQMSELDPEKRMSKMLDLALAIGDDEMWDLRKALMEMRAQTPHNQDFSEKFREIDKLVRSNFEEILDQKGAEKPEVGAELLISTIDGIMHRRISYEDREGLEVLKKRLEKVVSKLDDIDI